MALAFGFSDNDSYRVWNRLAVSAILGAYKNKKRKVQDLNFKLKELVES